ncbi:hypothetical protein ACIO8F_32625 [Streptomyces sp. NPDC087228]
MLTTLAQGAGMAMEDAVVLARTLAEPATGDDLVSALRAYDERAPRPHQGDGGRVPQDERPDPGGPPRRCLVRNAYFRVVPRHVLTRQTAQALTLWGSKSRRCRSRGVSILVDDAAEDSGAEQASVVEVVHDCGLFGRVGR